jgi:hypothetical protein
MDDLLANMDSPGWHALVASADYNTKITVGADSPAATPDRPDA